MRWLSDNLTSLLMIGFLVLGGMVLGFRFLGSTPNEGLVKVRVPDLSPQAQMGKVAFDANCAACHGANGAGTDQGPPFVHDIYNPGHHADAAFLFAAERGVQRHHWNFGDMPAQHQVSRAELADIVRYVRELQQANGIFYRPHQM